MVLKKTRLAPFLAGTPCFLAVRAYRSGVRRAPLHISAAHMTGFTTTYMPRVLAHQSDSGTVVVETAGPPMLPQS